MTYNYDNIKYSKLQNQDNKSDNNSDNSNYSDDVPLLSLEQNNNNITNDNDSDSILLNLNDNHKIIDNNSRYIVRFYLSTSLIVSFCLIILILGYKDYYDTSSDKIIFGSNGQLLFRYYYIINICFYLLFIAFSLYILIYIICYLNISQSIRDISFFKFIKINLFILNLNIIMKIQYGIFIILLNNKSNNQAINKIPDYYNFIISEIIMFMIIQSFHYCLIDKINNIINMLINITPFSLKNGTP